jgi:PAS domain S-box-containing protein
MIPHHQGQAPEIGVALDFADTPRLQSIESLRHTLEAVPSGMIITNSGGEIVLVNGQIESLFGYPRAELLGQRIESLVPQPPSKGLELCGVRKDGSEVAVEIGLTALQTDEGDFVLSSIVDITERKRAEERGQQQFKMLADLIPQLVWMAEPDGDILWYNQPWYDYTGTTFGQMQGRGWESVHDPRELPRVLERWQRCIVRGEPFEMVSQLKGKDGVFRPFLTRVTPIKNPEGNAERWFGTNTDVTELNRAAHAEQFMISVVQSAEHVILTKSLDGIVRSWNPAAELMLGYRADEIIGESVTRLIPDDLRDQEAMILGRIARGERIAHLETVRRRKDGSLVEVSLTVSPIRDHQGNVVGASKIMRDITERNRADAELKRSHERFAIAAQAAGQGFWDYDLDAKKLQWDPQMFNLYGRSVLDGEQPYALWADSVHPEDRERSERELADAIAGVRPFDTDFRIIQPSGAIRHIKSLARVKRNAEGRAVQMFGLNYDITERKHDTEQLRALNTELEQRVVERTAALAAANDILEQKNEEVEAFVYIVSHDLRAPLANLQGFSSELARSCAGLEETLRQADLKPDIESTVLSIVQEDITGALRYISASTMKFQRLIDTLLLLSRTGKQELRLEPADVRAIVDTTVLSLAQAIQSSGAEVMVEAVPDVTGDITAIGQVFSNLISNALKYLQPGRPGLILVGGHIRDGLAHYWVRDNGAGIPASAQRRLFQVFQRFHPDLASGDGMGLAIVKRIVERHGGRVWAESEEGVGTTFHIELPRAVDTRRGST